MRNFKFMFLQHIVQQTVISLQVNVDIRIYSRMDTLLNTKQQFLQRILLLQ